MGVGDQVPAALQQLGVNLTLIDADELAWGDLSKYHTIVTGVRAYERRADLRANNHRLLQYVENGGTAIVQYNKMEFNQAQYGPLPGRGELQPRHRRTRPGQGAGAGTPGVHLAEPHRRSAWQRWVQERGLYFLGDKDAEVRGPGRNGGSVSPTTAAPSAAPWSKRAHGKGRWVYVGLGLWRQLPAGTDGAYKLMANLVSLGKAK